MKNKYRFEGDKCYISLFGGRETVIDATDFDCVSSFPGTWVADYCKETNSYYCKIKSWVSHRTFFRGALHRVVLGVTDSKTPVDHINHDTLDNTRANIRVASSRVNACNRIRPQSNNRTGYLGVCFHKKNGVYMAYIEVDGRRRHLGCFTDAVTAAFAYREAKLKYHGILLPEPTPQSKEHHI